MTIHEFKPRFGSDFVAHYNYTGTLEELAELMQTGKTGAPLSIELTPAVAAMFGVRADAKYIEAWSLTCYSFSDVRTSDVDRWRFAE